MKVTNVMISKWARAALLIIFGIVLVIYIDAVMQEFSLLFSHSGSGEASMIMMLLTALFWIVALWCFVSAALNIITSFREPKLSIDDLGAKLDELQRMITERQPGVQAPVQKPMVIEQARVEAEKPVGPEVPPPPP